MRIRPPFPLKLSYFCVMSIETLNIDLRKKVMELVNQNESSQLAKIVEDLSSKEVIHLIGHLNQTEQNQLFTLLSPEDAAEMLEEIPEAQAVHIIEDLKTEDAAAILDEMESDDQADIIMELDHADAEAILQVMQPAEAASVRKLLAYQPDTAGGMMHTEYFAFFEDQTIQSVTEDLRRNAEKYAHFKLKYIFVISRSGVLKGVLQMQDLLLAGMRSTLSDIIVREISFVDHQVSLDDLIDFFDTYDWFGVPVVDEEEKLVGVVLRRDIRDEQSERQTLEHLESQGIVGGEELRTMPVLLRAKRRLSWLSVNIFLNIIAASVIALNQDVLSSVIALAVFLPIISDMSGCSGNQAVAVSMRELSIGAVKPGEVLRVLRQEISVGLINGLVLGSLIAIAAFLWKGSFYLGLVVGGALTINTLLAVCLGGTVPLILKGFNVDPALASGPILTTITDMVGFFLTLTFASLALARLGGL